MIAEQYLDGREFTVAILKKEHGSGFEVMPLELCAPINANGQRFLSATIKQSDTETYQKVSDQLLAQKLSRFALAIFKAFGARDYGRIDIRLNSEGALFFLEANLMPSFLENYGNFPKACNLYLNYSYSDMVQHIVRLGLTRKANFEVHTINDSVVLKATLD